MGLTEFAVKRPVAMSMIIMMFVVLGLYSFRMIGVDLLPTMNIPYVSVTVTYPEAGAEEVETQVIKPLEAGLSSVSELKNISSEAVQGAGVITLEFASSANGDAAESNVQKIVDSLRGQLPKTAGTPVVQKVNTNATPVMVLAVKSTMPVSNLYHIVDNTIKGQLQRVGGVSDVALSGGQAEEVHVDLNENILANYGVSINTVINQLGAVNVNQPSGQIERPNKEYNLRVLGQFGSLEDIRRTQISLPDGGSVPLSALGKVEMGYHQLEEYSRINGVPAIGVTIYKQSDASVTSVGDALKAALPAIRKELPPGVQIVVATDYSQYVHAAVDSTFEAILEGILTTALVLLIFLRQWRSMLTVALAIPTSLIFTIMGMYFLRFTFNMLSLMGMALCIGILVDDSIVVLENIRRHRAMGKSAWQAAIDGRSEIAMAAIAITLSDVVVYTPIAFLHGALGQVFRQFGLTVVLATVFSLFVSFTLTPMLAARLDTGAQNSEMSRLKAIVKGASLKGRLLKRINARVDRLWALLDRFGRWFARTYGKVLDWSLVHRKTVLFGSAAAFIAALMVFPLGFVGAGFMPQMDKGQLTVDLQLPVGTPLAQTNKAMTALETYVKAIPEVHYYQTTVGSGSGFMATGANRGEMDVTLWPKSERHRSVWQVADQIRHFGKSFDQGKITVNAGSGGAAIDLEISGSDYQTLVPLADKIESMVRKIPGTMDIKSDYQLGQPEVQVKVNDQLAAGYGLSTQDVAAALSAAVNGDVATEYQAGNRDIDVVVRIAGMTSASIRNLGRITIATPSGDQVPLDQLATITEGTGPTAIHRTNRERTITITGNVEPNVSQSTINAAIKRKLAGMKLPQGYTVTAGGNAQNMASSFENLLLALLISIAMVYMILAALYESLSTPLIRMLSLPLGLVGALLALAITGKSLDLFSMLGIIMMDGLVAKNGTLLLDYTLHLVQKGEDVREALREAGRARLLPIMMTTIVMIVGMMPTALAMTAGSEVRSGMAVVLMGGLITSTFFTLVVIPVVFTLITEHREEKYRKRMGKLQRAVARIQARSI